MGWHFSTYAPSGVARQKGAAVMTKNAHFFATALGLVLLGTIADQGKSASTTLSSPPRAPARATVPAATTRGGMGVTNALMEAGVPTAEEVEAVRSRLKAEDMQTVLEGIRRIEGLGEAGTTLVPELVALLDDPRTMSVTTGGGHGGSVTRQVSVKTGAVGALAGLGRPAAQGLWEVLVGKENEAKRGAAAEAMQKVLFGSEGRRRVGTWSSHSRRDVDLASYEIWVRSLKRGEWREAGVEESIAKLIGELDGKYTLLAPFVTAGKLKGDSAVENAELLWPAMEVLGDTRRQAAHVYGLVKGGEAVPVILGLSGELQRMHLNKEDSLICNEVPRIGAGAVAPLVKAIADKANADRKQLCWVLYGISDPEAGPELVKQLTHEDPLVREWAANTLAVVKDVRAVPALIETMKKDEDAEVRRSAAWTLGQTPDPKLAAIKPLMEALRDDKAWGVRLSAAGSLGWLSPYDSAVVEALKAALEADENEYVKEHAAKAIDELRKKRE
jgi:hypothetical protein